MSADSIKAVAHRFFGEVLTVADPKVVDEVIAADYVLFLTGASHPIRGAVGLRRLVSWYKTPFADLEFQIDDMIAEDNRVATRFWMIGMHLGRFQGVPTTRKRISVRGSSFQYFVEEKISVNWISFDQLGMLQQLRVFPLPESDSLQWGPHVT